MVKVLPSKGYIRGKNFFLVKVISRGKGFAQ